MYLAEFYTKFRDTLAASKPAGVGLVIGPAFHDHSGLSTSIELTVYQGMSNADESALITELYRRVVGKYNEKMGLAMSATEISQWALELGAVAARTTFIDGSTDLYQAPPNTINPVLPLSVTITSRIPKEISPANVGGAGEELL